MVPTCHAMSRARLPCLSCFVQGDGGAISGHQWSPVAISGHQWPSVAISGRQWSSMAISVIESQLGAMSGDHQWHSPACSGRRHASAISGNQSQLGAVALACLFGPKACERRSMSAETPLASSAATAGRRSGRRASKAALELPNMEEVVGGRRMARSATHSRATIGRT